MPYIQKKPKVLVLSGYGLNCEDEMCFAFETVGFSANIIHVNRLISNSALLDQYQVLAIPGGFSYGDHTGSGNALAWKMRNSIWEELNDFVREDKLTIGVCNGCQVLVNLGLVPFIHNGSSSVACAVNESNIYQCRWVRLKVTNDSVWLKDIDNIMLPVAHGEGNFTMHSDVMGRVKNNRHIAMQYMHKGDSQKSELCNSDLAPAQGLFPHNPNGAMNDIAALSDASGKVLAMMPHPERAILYTQREDWFAMRRLSADKTLPKYSESPKIFSNALDYFS